jgi:hypothetical protein
MTSLTPNQSQSLTAFLIALSQQAESLPAGLQAQLPAIGLNLANRIVELPAIAASIPSLEQNYRAILTKLQAQETEPSEGVVLASTGPTDYKYSTEISNSAVEILTDPDPVKAAQKHLAQETSRGQNILQRLFHPKSSLA